MVPAPTIPRRSGGMVWLMAPFSPVSGSPFIGVREVASGGHAIAGVEGRQAIDARVGLRGATYGALNARSAACGGHAERSHGQYRDTQEHVDVQEDHFDPFRHRSLQALAPNQDAARQGDGDHGNHQKVL